jgi:hypothetical protein
VFERSSISIELTKRKQQLTGLSMVKPTTVWYLIGVARQLGEAKRSQAVLRGGTLRSLNLVSRQREGSPTQGALPVLRIVEDGQLRSLAVLVMRCNG